MIRALAQTLAHPFLTTSKNILLVVLIALLLTACQDSQAKEWQCGADSHGIHQLYAQHPPHRDWVIEGIVTQIMPGMEGFSLQAPRSQWQQQGQVSQAVFVHQRHHLEQLQPGDRLRLQGRVQLADGMSFVPTQPWLHCGSGSLPEPVPLSWPLNSVDQLAAHQAMLIRIPQGMRVVDSFNLARYGELMLASEWLWQPTQLWRPGPEVQDYLAALGRKTLLLDDNSWQQNPAMVPYPQPGLLADNSIRVGDELQDLQGILHFARGHHRLLPSHWPSHVRHNPRPEPPTWQPGLRIVSFNVENYFNGDGQGAGFPTARGARTLAEFQRQQQKLLAALLALDAHILALVELENDGFDQHSAIASLSRALASASGHPWRFVSQEQAIGTDAIIQGFLYRADLVQPEGDLHWLDSSNSVTNLHGQPLFNDRIQRPSLAQVFVDQRSQQPLLLSLHHWKAKGSNCDAWNDPDLQDGQANCNQTRLRAAQAVHAWLERPEWQGMPRLILGDLNAYAQEDPLHYLYQQGWQSVFTDPKQYSYLFRGLAGQLDHALVDAKAKPLVAQAGIWHINAAEPRALGYSQRFKSSRQQREWFAPDPFRSSDHDPIYLLLAWPE